MTSFLEEVPNIYKRFNETTTDTALKNMFIALKRIIKSQKMGMGIDDTSLKIIKNIMGSITFCEEGLINENSDATPENKHLFGVDAVEYFFWKLVHASDKSNTGLNPGQLFEFFKRYPVIIKSALKGVCFDKETMDKHKELEKDGKYMQDCYARILQTLEKSLSTT